MLTQLYRITGKKKGLERKFPNSDFTKIVQGSNNTPTDEMY